MKGRRTLESIAEQTSEMWENGCTSPQISDLIAKEVGNIVCESPMREKAAGMYCADAFHPFNLANMDINVVRRLCTALHDFGRSRFAAYKMVLMSNDVFRQEVRTTVWMDYMGVALFSRRYDWLKLYLALYVGIRGNGYELVRNMYSDIIGHVSRKYIVSDRLKMAFREDSIGEFEMLKVIENVRFTKTMVRDMLKSPNGGQIVAHLIKTDVTIRHAFPPAEMLFYICSSSENGTKGTIIAEALAEVAPECVKAVDPFGLTPLDYINIGMRTSSRFLVNSMGWDSSCICGLNLWDDFASTLVRLGCNPYHVNRYGISYADVRRALYPLVMEHTIRVGPEMYSIGKVNDGENLKRQIIEARKKAISEVYWGGGIDIG